MVTTAQVFNTLLNVVRVLRNLVVADVYRAFCDPSPVFFRGVINDFNLWGIVLNFKFNFIFSHDCSLNAGYNPWIGNDGLYGVVVD
jgi:hypothetical protein